MAVMLAAAGVYPKCSKLMINEGVDVNAVATSVPDYLKKLAKMIEEGMVEPNEDPHIDGVTWVHFPAKKVHLECVKILIVAREDITILDKEERTPVFLAVKGNYVRVMPTLIRAGADPNPPYVDDKC